MAALALLLAPALACAGVTVAERAEVGLAPPADARIPPDLALPDLAGRAVNLVEALAGRPALLVPVDYTCRTTCGPALTVAAAALAESGLQAGRDYTLVVVGLDPKDGAGEAEAMVQARMGQEAMSQEATGQEASSTQALVLLGDAAGTPALLAALGYRTRYDPGTDQFVHPAGAVALAPDGRVARVLSTLALNPRDLRLALVEAGEGRIGDLGDRLTLLCSGFDPVHGVYTPLIRRVLAGAGLLTLAALAGAILLLRRRERTRSLGAG
jgi:protein SCO1/2